MEIIRAEHSGFCFGVKHAIDTVFEQIDKLNITAFAGADGAAGNLYTCGQIIHNRDVTDRIKSMGVGMITDLSEAHSGDVVIVRSHGEPEEFYEEAARRGIEIIDTTCIFVKKIHDYVKKAQNDERNVIIIGNREHPEVIATNGWCKCRADIIDSTEAAEEYIAARSRSICRTDNNNDDDCSCDKTPLIVCQTTFREEVLNEILSIFDASGIKYELKNTICSATKYRQESCAKLSSVVDLMLVIGDYGSSNSKKLFEISRKNCKNVKFVRNSSDLELKEIKKYNKIGITAGASTPEWIIKEVISSMNENVIREQEHNPMLDYMDDIENSLRLPRPGEIVDGTIHQVMENEVIVNIGCKKDGVLPKSEVALEEGQSLADLFNEGDEIEAKVLKLDDGEGGILLSKKKLEMNENYKELNEALENKETITVKLIRVVNGGIIAAYKEITGFVPMSQLSDRYVELDKADEYIGQVVDVKVIRVDNRRNRAVFSRKAVLLEDKRKQIAEIWANLNVGDIVEGKVMRFTDYGAFVDIGGVDGLLHISEISWGKLKHPQEVLAIGDIINVKILSLNEEKGKISLGLKQTQPEPWTLVGTKYNVGQIITGKVVQLKEYGAFVELEAGLDGLVHISEIANKRVENVSDELKLGQEITAKIMEIDTDRRRISLSIKALSYESSEESDREISENVSSESTEDEKTAVVSEDNSEEAADKTEVVADNVELSTAEEDNTESEAVPVHDEVENSVAGREKVADTEDVAVDETGTAADDEGKEPSDE